MILKNKKTITANEAKIAENTTSITQIREQAKQTASIEALKSEAKKMEKKADDLEKQNKKLTEKNE